MSGLDKSISTCLTHGPVEKIPYSKAYILLGDFTQTGNGSITNMKCDGRKISFSTDTVKKADGKCQFSWNIAETKQVDGFTIFNKFASNNKSFQGWVDFGSTFTGIPSLTTHFGYNLNLDEKDYKAYYGLTWVNGNFGWKS